MNLNPTIILCTPGFQKIFSKKSIKFEQDFVPVWTQPQLKYGWFYLKMD